MEFDEPSSVLRQDEFPNMPAFEPCGREGVHAERNPRDFSYGVLGRIQWMEDTLARRLPYCWAVVRGLACQSGVDSALARASKRDWSSIFPRPHAEVEWIERARQFAPNDGPSETADLFVPQETVFVMPRPMDLANYEAGLMSSAILCLGRPNELLARVREEHGLWKLDRMTVVEWLSNSPRAFVDSLPTRDAAPELNVDGTFKRSGGGWLVGYGNSPVVALKDLRGLGLIQNLLRQPERPQFLTGPESLLRIGDPMLDDDALRSIRIELDRIREERAQAELSEDAEKIAELDREVALIQRYRSESTRPNRGSRALDPDVNRARSADGKARKKALTAILGHCPQLHEHLVSSLHGITGIAPCYRPDGHLLWDFGD